MLARHAQNVEDVVLWAEEPPEFFLSVLNQDVSYF